MRRAIRQTWRVVLGLVALNVVARSASAQELNLPNPLQRADLSLVTSAEQWRDEQRGRLLDLFQEHVYGRPSVGRPAGMTFQVVELAPQAMAGAATLKRVEIALPNASGSASLTLRLTLFLPNAALGEPVPTFLLINNRPESNTDPTRATQTEFWPAETVIAEGYGVAAFHVSDVDPDEPAFDNGVHQVFDAGERGESSWGALAAWAWGASRVMDYFETDAQVDARRVAVLGHSRGGKAALIAGATDERFALTISNDSGEGGAALARRNQGESIAAINTTFPHWFALKYREYNGAPETLPVDQHELIALMAPRAVYVASASEDAWADPEGEFLSAVNAAPVYQLFGLSALGSEQFPAVGEHIHGQQMGYHLRPGAHDLTQFDWDLYMDFFRTVQVLDGDEPSGAGGAASGGAGGSAEPAAGSGVGGTPSGSASLPGSAGASVAGAGSAQEPNAEAPSVPASPRADVGAGCACRLVPGKLAANTVSLLGLLLAAAASRRRFSPRRGASAHSARPVSASTR